MQTVTNESYVRGRNTIANYLNFASMALLLVGMALSFMTGQLGSLAIWISYVALVFALLLLNIARPFTRRFGAKWRQDQWLAPNMKGLDARATLFNFASPKLPDHILVAPSGLYVLLPKPNGGKVIFDGSRWSRGSLAGGLFRGIAEGGLGNPTDEIRRAMALMADYLRANGTEDLIKGLEAKPIIVFTNPGVQLEVRNSQIQVVNAKELRALFRRAKPTLSPEKIEELDAVLGREAGQ